MYLAVVCGDKHLAIRNSLISNLDNVSVDTFATVQELIKAQSSRQYRYNRILVTSQVIRRDTENILKELVKFNKTYCETADILLIASANQDAEIAEHFAQIFNSGLHVAVLIDKLTVSSLQLLSVNNLNDIRANFKIANGADISAEVDQYPTEEKPEQQLQKKEKKGLFEGIFGGRKKKKTGGIFKKNKNQEEMDTTQVTNYSEEYDNNELSEYDNTSDTNNENSVQNLESEENNNYKLADVQIQHEDVEVQEELQNLDTATIIATNNDSYKSDEDYEEYEDTEVDNSLDTDEAPFNAKNETIEETEDTEHSDNSGNYADEYSEDEISDFEKEHNINSNELGAEQSDNSDDVSLSFEVDDDLSVMQGEIDYNSENLSVIDDEDVQEIGDLEEIYRQKQEQVKVVEKVVEKVVISNSNDIVENIIKGGTTKVIVVTGDRASGVTSTAYEIAKFFAKQTHVLYLDGDLATHGVLNYLSYDKIRRYDMHQLKGTKLCKSAKAFEQCALKYDTNLDFLLSDYGTEITEDEFIQTQAIVSEIAHTYGVVVVDIPFNYLHLCEDLILVGVPVVCMEANKRGFMNTIYYLDEMKLNKRYKRTIQNKGSLVLTKINPKLRLDDLKAYIEDTIEFDEINWLSMPLLKREGSVTKEFLNKLMEG